MGKEFLKQRDPHKQLTFAFTIYYFLLIQRTLNSNPYPVHLSDNFNTYVQVAKNKDPKQYLFSFILKCKTLEQTNKQLSKKNND